MVPEAMTVPRTIRTISALFLLFLALAACRYFKERDAAHRNMHLCAEAIRHLIDVTRSGESGLDCREALLVHLRAYGSRLSQSELSNWFALEPIVVQYALALDLEDSTATAAREASASWRRGVRDARRSYEFGNPVSRGPLIDPWLRLAEIDQVLQVPGYAKSQSLCREALTLIDKSEERWREVARCLRVLGHALPPAGFRPVRVSGGPSGNMGRLANKPSLTSLQRELLSDFLKTGLFWASCWALF
jgi:hypothetical protein